MSTEMVLCSLFKFLCKPQLEFHSTQLLAAGYWDFPRICECRSQNLQVGSSPMQQSAARNVILCICSVQGFLFGGGSPSTNG